MPGLMDVLGPMLGGDVTRQLSDKIGADPEQTGNAIQAALPMLLSGLTNNASSTQGSEALLGALQRDHDGSVLDDLGGLFGGTAPGGNATDGAGILGHLFGDRREAAHEAVARTSGLNAAQAGQLLMLLAPMVMGALGRAQRTRGLDANGLQSMLHGERANAAQSQPDLMGLANQILDRNHDGSAVDDVVRGLGGMFGKR